MQTHVTRSRTNLPVVSESGGGSTNTGYCQIVAGRDGQPVKPLFVPRGRSNEEHALFVAQPGMFLLDTARDRSSESVRVVRITGIAGDLLEVEEVGAYENGDSDLPESLTTAVGVALAKGRCYHCREAHYIAQAVHYEPR